MVPQSRSPGLASLLRESSSILQLPLTPPNAGGHTLACSKQIPWRGKDSPSQTQLGLCLAGSECQPQAFMELFPQGISQSRAWTLPSLFDPGIAKPLIYSASLVVSEVLALMVPTRVEKTRPQRRPQVTWMSPVISFAQWVPVGLRMVRGQEERLFCGD